MIHFVEKTWGLRFAMGGTGALVQRLMRKFEELGRTILYNSEVARINVTDQDGGEPQGWFAQRFAHGVILVDGTRFDADCRFKR